MFIIDFFLQWSEISINWNPEGLVNRDTVKWSFDPNENHNSVLLFSSHLVGSSSVDVNLDGLADLAMGLVRWDGLNSKKYPAILVNNGLNNQGQLTMSVHLLPGVNLPISNTNVRQMGFFDVGEDVS